MQLEHRDSWRLLLTDPMPGAQNMALDEVILDDVAVGASAPVVRLFSWQPPCLSLGYGQSINDIDEKRLSSHGWEIVRRLTGGRAILHTEELTYSICGPVDSPHLSGGILESYRHLSHGLLATLADLGLQPEVQPEVKIPQVDRNNPVCFEVPSSYEITVQGKKLIGSAQVRRKDVVLQHGSIPLKGDIARICQVLRFKDDARRKIVSERVRARASTVQDLLAKPISWQTAAEAFLTGFSKSLGWEFDRSEITADERSRAELLVKEKYSHRSWTTRV
jgi:lipoate-protein ligase A